MKSHPAWHDLGAEARREAFEATVRLRKMEAAIDPEGLSTTARVVLERIRGTGGEALDGGGSEG